MSKVPKITSLQYICNIFWKNGRMKLIFCMQISSKLSYKLILSILLGMAIHAKSSQNNKFAKFKERTDEWSRFFVQIKVKGNNNNNNIIIIIIIIIIILNLFRHIHFTWNWLFVRNLYRQKRNTVQWDTVKESVKILRNNTNLSNLSK